MTAFLAAMVVVGFAILLERLPLGVWLGAVRAETNETLRLLRDAATPDAEKAGALRRSARRLVVGAVMIVLLGGAALGLPILGVWLLDLAGAADLIAVLDLLQRWDFLLVATLLGTAAYLLARRFAR